MTCLALYTSTNRCYYEASNSLLQHSTELTLKLLKDAQVGQVARMVEHHCEPIPVTEAVEAILTMPIKDPTHSLLTLILLMCLQGLGTICKATLHHQQEIGGLQMVKHSVKGLQTLTTGTRKDTPHRIKGKAMDTHLRVGIMVMYHHRLLHIVVTVVTGQVDSLVIDETLCCQYNITFNHYELYQLNH